MPPARGGSGASLDAHRPYDPDDIDAFAVVNGDLRPYLIPASVVGGLQAIHVGAYEDYRLDQGQPTTGSTTQAQPIDF